MDLTQAHHLFFQRFLTGETFSINQIHQLLEAIIEIYPNQFTISQESQQSIAEQIFPNFLNQINSHLFSLDLEIRKGINQTTGELIYYLVNLNSDELSIFATQYTSLELNYLKNLIEAILVSNNEFCIKTSVALRDIPTHPQSVSDSPTQSASNGPSMTKLEREQLIDRFIHDDWLCSPEGTGLITLSDKCLIDLREKLLNEFQSEIFPCKLCMNLVTQGYQCQNDSCNTYYHHPCLEQFLTDINTNLSDNYQLNCLNCQTTWNPKLIGNKNWIQFDPIYLNE